MCVCVCVRVRVRVRVCVCVPSHSPSLALLIFEGIVAAYIVSMYHMLVHIEHTVRMHYMYGSELYRVWCLENRAGLNWGCVAVLTPSPLGPTAPFLPASAGTRVTLNIL